MTLLRRTVVALTITIGGFGVPVLAVASPSQALQTPSVTNAIVVSPAKDAPTYSAIGPSPIAAAAYQALIALHGDSADRYAATISELATLIAGSTGFDRSSFVAVWTAASSRRMTAMLAALSQVGAGYRSRSSVAGGSFDCSGLTSWAWAQAGTSIARQSRAIISSISPVTLDTVKPGDVLYYPGHVMVSLGVSDAIVHAADRRHGVEVTTLRGRHRNLLAGDPLA
jgi:cell wall-associated NlpC family hydrolase